MLNRAEYIELHENPELDNLPRLEKDVTEYKIVIMVKVEREGTFEEVTEGARRDFKELVEWLDKKTSYWPVGEVTGKSVFMQEE
jgi:hypothetical protein